MNKIDVKVGRAEIAATLALRELRRALSLHPTGMRSAHEGYAVLAEEVDELWDEVKANPRSEVAIRAEAIQVAAMALRFLVEVCDV